LALHQNFFFWGGGGFEREKIFFGFLILFALVHSYTVCLQIPDLLFHLKLEDWVHALLNMYRREIIWREGANLRRLVSHWYKLGTTEALNYFLGYAESII